MPRLFIPTVIASIGFFFAAGSPIAHLLALTAFAILQSRLNGDQRRLATWIAISPLVIRGLLSSMGETLMVDELWPPQAGRATLLHHVTTIFCMAIVFTVSNLGLRTNQSLGLIGSSGFQTPIENAEAIDDHHARIEASESVVASEFDELEFDVACDHEGPSHRTTSEQRTQFIFPLTGVKSAHLAYDLEPDEVLDDLTSRITVDELMSHLAQAEVSLPEHFSFNSTHKQNAAQVIEALVQARVLTQYQAMLICCGLPELLNVGPYQVIERIGRGGMALVLQVRDRHTKHIYALKLLAEIDSLNDVLRQRFLREMDAVRELAHPNIAVARTVGQHGRFLYIAMEWVQGCNLAQYVHDNGPLPAATAIYFIRQASEALQYAHERGLVHRDVKPANLILGSNGEIKLVDMGLARFVDVIEQHSERRSNHWKTDTGHLMGTIDYMAPEQALDLSLADQRSDIYSLGCTLFYLLTGETHLRGSTQRRRAVSLVNKSGMRDLRDVKEGFDPCIYALVKKMIKVSPQDRFQSIKELLVAIDECATQFGLPSLLDKAYRVLVVEDSPTQAMITCEQLKATSRHFIPVDVATLAMACDRLSAETFDVVLLDLNLPDSSGIETITSVRQANGTVPILVLTSNSDPAVGVKCIEAGADDFLPKDALDVLTLERHILLTMSRREITVL